MLRRPVKEPVGFLLPILRRFPQMGVPQNDQNGWFIMENPSING
jgi:hypothetical protein